MLLFQLIPNLYRFNFYRQKEITHKITRIACVLLSWAEVVVFYKLFGLYGLFFPGFLWIYFIILDGWSFIFTAIYWAIISTGSVLFVEYNKYHCLPAIMGIPSVIIIVFPTIVGNEKTIIEDTLITLLQYPLLVFLNFMISRGFREDIVERLMDYTKLVTGILGAGSYHMEHIRG